MKNYSRQREAILQALQNNKTHPTAKEVYKIVRQTIPNISLGTVYRNLAELSAESQTITIKVGDGCEHYDGDTVPHIHLYCKKCGKITDLPLNTAPFGQVLDTGFRPESLSCVVNGVCADCAKKHSGTT